MSKRSDIDKMDEFRTVRQELFPKFAAWHGYDWDTCKNHEIYTLLHKFLHFRTETMGILHWEESDQAVLDTMKLLNGPNGYTIFRMKQCQKQLKLPQTDQPVT